ncbi:MAG TPA: cyclic peptide export ABC transporter [Steroidobacteraceae bacterium]
MDEPVRRPQTDHWGKLVGLVWRTYPWLTLLTAVCAVVSGLASVAVIDVINRAIHHAGDRTQWPAFIALNVLAIALKNVSSVLPAYISKNIITSLRIALCRKILTTSLEEIEKRGASSLLTVLTNDIPALSQTFLLLPTILGSAAIFLFGIAYLAYLSRTVFLLTIASMAFGVVIHFLVLNRAMSFSRRTRDEISALNEHAQGLVFGIKELQLNRERRRWFKREGIDIPSRRVAQYGFISHLWFTGGSNIEPVVFAILLGVLVFGVASFQLFDTATLTACILIILYIIGPLALLVGAIPQLGQGAIACERLAALGFSIDQNPANGAHDDSDVATEEPVPSEWKCIELRGVKARYFDQSTASFELGPINMEIHPGELVFVIGGNGSGKSTLAKVLTGLYMPVDGQVLLDGQPVRGNLDRYRSLFSAVFADFHVFDRVLGRDKDASASSIAREYLGMLGLADKVRIRDETYSTTKALSSGQRRRLALVSAYLEDRPIYVLDEWAADQDPPLKKLFYTVLLPDLKRRGKCVIIITHDDQYFEAADRIVKLLDGKIVAEVLVGNA